MPAFELNPLSDARWDDFVEQHPRASIFHTGGWLRALRDTYQYQPRLFTSRSPGLPLEDGILFCEVNSWITGRRLVSLPFSDHCDPLMASPTVTRELIEHLRTMMITGKYRYIEIRPGSAATCLADSHAISVSERFLLHTLPLDLPLCELFQNLHKDCIQRKIHRAERESLKYATGRSDLLLRNFYQLLLRTRRRHCLPPQPFQWFRNLSKYLGGSSRSPRGLQSRPSRGSNHHVKFQRDSHL